MDERMRALERAALAGDPLAARELEVLRARTEDLSLEERVRRLVVARYELVIDYNPEWSTGVTELGAYALRTLELLQGRINHGDKAKCKRLADQIFKQVSPERAARREQLRERQAAWRPFHDWQARIHELLYGPRPPFVRHAAGTVSQGEPVPHVPDLDAVQAVLDNPPPTDDPEVRHFIETNQQWWRSELARRRGT